MNEQLQVLGFLFNACEQKTKEIQRLQGQVASLQQEILKVKADPPTAVATSSAGTPGSLANG